MNLRTYLSALRRHLAMILAFALLGLCVSVGYYLTASRVYASTLQFYVSTPLSEGGNAQAADQFAQNRVNSYVRLFSTEEFAERVIAQAGLELTTQQVIERINASADVGTVLIQVTVSDSDPERVHRLAEAVAQNFGPMVDELDNAGRDSQLVRIILVTPPSQTRQVSPDRNRLLLLGLAVGLMLGVTAAVAREMLDSRIRNDQDLAELTGVPSIAVVPQIPDPPMGPVLLADGPDPVASEAIRRVRSALLPERGETAPVVVQVASPGSQEGRTTLVLNMALLLARLGRSVLVIDADLRSPSIAKTFELPPAPGLADVLGDETLLEDCLVRHEVGRFWVLPAGHSTENPADLLARSQLPRLLAGLRERYDYIILDSPPLLSVSDASSIAAHADGVLLVVREGSSRRDELRLAAETLADAGAPLLGTVLNGGRARRMRSIGRAGRPLDWPAAVPAPPAGRHDARPLPSEPTGTQPPDTVVRAPESALDPDGPGDTPTTDLPLADTMPVENDLPHAAGSASERVNEVPPRPVQGDPDNPAPELDDPDRVADDGSATEPAASGDMPAQTAESDRADVNPPIDEPAPETSQPPTGTDLDVHDPDLETVPELDALRIHLAALRTELDELRTELDEPATQWDVWGASETIWPTSTLSERELFEVVPEAHETRGAWSGIWPATSSATIGPEDADTTAPAGQRDEPREPVSPWPDRLTGRSADAPAEDEPHQRRFETRSLLSELWRWRSETPDVPDTEDEITELTGQDTAPRLTDRSAWHSDPTPNSRIPATNGRSAQSSSHPDALDPKSGSTGIWPWHREPEVDTEGEEPDEEAALGSAATEPLADGLQQPGSLREPVLTGIWPWPLESAGQHETVAGEAQAAKDPVSESPDPDVDQEFAAPQTDGREIATDEEAGTPPDEPETDATDTDDLTDQEADAPQDAGEIPAEPQAPATGRPEADDQVTDTSKDASAVLEKSEAAQPQDEGTVDHEETCGQEPDDQESVQEADNEENNDLEDVESEPGMAEPDSAATDHENADQSTTENAESGLHADGPEEPGDLPDEQQEPGSTKPQPSQVDTDTPPDLETSQETDESTDPDEQDDTDTAEEGTGDSADVDRPGEEEAKAEGKPESTAGDPDLMAYDDSNEALVDTRPLPIIKLTPEELAELEQPSGGSSPQGASRIAPRGPILERLLEKVRQQRKHLHDAAPTPDAETDD